MKRTGIVLTLILILAMLFAPLCYAGGLSVVKVTPSDGEKGKQPQNMAVKVTFSENISLGKCVYEASEWPAFRKAVQCQRSYMGNPVVFVK